MDCIFCKIISGGIPAFKVYEDDYILAILDIAPVNPGHVLVFPKKHLENYEMMNNERLSKVYEGVKKIGLAIKESLRVPGYTTIVNNDPVAGQIIPHFHVHIIPRNEKDDLRLWPGGVYQEGEAEEIFTKIKNNI